MGTRGAGKAGRLGSEVAYFAGECYGFSATPYGLIDDDPWGGISRCDSIAMSNRMRFCIKFALVFATLIGPPSAFAQLSPTRPESIVVFAPHPDDEVIGCAGIIMQALERGARVKVIDITSGDGFDAAAAGLTHKKVDEVGPDDFFALSRLRQTQSRHALEILGGKADDLIVLGYPDGDLGNLYDSTDDKVIRQQFTKKNETYALIQKDYHSSVHGEPVLYQRRSVLGDLVELLTILQPTEIYVTDETDGHVDHRAAFWFVRDAAEQVGYKGAFFTYLVHGLPAWPFPPGVTLSRPFESRKVKGEVAPRGLPWPPPRRIPLTLGQAQRKLKSIQAHNIPVVGMPDHQKEMESFVKSEEVFWTPLAPSR
jgi:LmbE family N-acetylglucosaminyl deacetylase